MNRSATVEIVTPTDREVVLTRVFQAPRNLVFDAMTTPELIKRWMLAPGRVMTVCEIDLRVGGAFHFVWSGEGKKDVGMRGAYVEIVPGERLVNTEFWDDWDAGEIRVESVFVENSGKTTFTTTALYPSREVRDSVLKSGFQENATETYDRLASLLAAIE